jgi:CBS domain-containing protein
MMRTRKGDPMSSNISDQVAGLAPREAVVARPDETLRSIVHKLWSESIGAVVVVDERRHPLGVVSERDIVAAVAQGAELDSRTAGETMTRFVVSVRPEDPLFEAAGHMIEDGVRHLPIIDQYGQLTGVVSVRDLLRPLLLDALVSHEPVDH